MRSKSNIKLALQRIKWADVYANKIYIDFLCTKTHAFLSVLSYLLGVCCRAQSQ